VTGSNMSGSGRDAPDEGSRDDGRSGDKPGSARKKPVRDAPLPPAGPHADPALTDEEATPGAGTLPPPDGEPGGGGSVSS
jgi:hypothetical protein